MTCRNICMVQEGRERMWWDTDCLQWPQLLLHANHLQHRTGVQTSTDVVLQLPVSMNSNTLKTHALGAKMDQKLSTCKKWRSWTGPLPVGVYFKLHQRQKHLQVSPCSISFMSLFMLPAKDCFLKCLWSKKPGHMVYSVFQSWLSYTGIISSDSSPCTRRWARNHGTECAWSIFSASCILLSTI